MADTKNNAEDFITRIFYQATCHYKSVNTTPSIIAIQCSICALLLILWKKINHPKSNSDSWLDSGSPSRSPRSPIRSMTVLLSLLRWRRSSRDKNGPCAAASTS